MGVKTKLRTHTSAYNFGNLKACKKAKYDLLRSIKIAKRDYKDGLESNFLDVNLSCL